MDFRESKRETKSNERENSKMRMIVAALILTLCHSLESDTKKGTIQEGAICDELEAEQAIIELHDDLDDDDDGAISTTGKALYDFL